LLSDDGEDFISYYGCTRNWGGGAWFPDEYLHWDYPTADAVLLSYCLNDPDNEECQSDCTTKTDPRTGVEGDDDIDIVACACTGDLCNASDNLHTPAIAALLSAFALSFPM